MGYQASLTPGNPSYPDKLQDDKTGDVYLFLGVDDELRGHYWLQSEMLHSVVYAVNEDYEIMETVNWTTDDTVDRYLERYKLNGLSELAQNHLEDGQK